MKINYRLNQKIDAERDVGLKVYRESRTGHPRKKGNKATKKIWHEKEMEN